MNAPLMSYMDAPLANTGIVKRLLFILNHFNLHFYPSSGSVVVELSTLTQQARVRSGHLHEISFKI